MSINRFLALFIVVVAVISLAACERPASQAPTGETTPTSGTAEFPLPGVTDDVMGQLESFATQTAIAMSGGTPQTQPQATQAATAQAPAASPTTAPPAAPTEAPTVAAVAYATPTPGIPSTYTLQKGEHPYCIARRFDVNPLDILSLSGLSASGNYSPGTVLTIPKSGSNFPGNRALKSHPTTYTVSAGDTFYTISCDFGDVDPNTLAAANGMSPNQKPEAGKKLNIP
ncbi:MAG TPA: LysM peptidoglycan-binding domain-containing protein [Anaerolineales bacterium]|nr:LysM peptidoglycan-binding domain-containing protein [Anaerolineales bacterium]